MSGISPVQPAAAEDNTFLSSWNGTVFEEEVDPFERFDTLEVSDPDGDGFAEVPEPPDPHDELLNGTHVNRTNDEIEQEMTEMGISQDDIALQIDSVLENSTYDDEEEKAINQVYDGLYLEAPETLEGTPAQVYVWCNRHAWDWYWGAPYPADCEGLAAPEVALVSTLTYVEFDSNQNIEALEGVFKAQGTDALGGAPMGFGIKTPEPGVSVGGQESYVENWQIDWDVSGLTSDVRDFDLTWKHNDLQTFDTGDKFHIGTFNNLPHHNYVHFTVGDAITKWDLSGYIDNEPGKPSRSVWNGQFHLNLDASPLMDAVIEVQYQDTRVKMVNLPNEITAAWWNDNSRDTGGTRKHFELRTPTEKREFELRGKTEVSGSKPWKYSWVGLPERSKSWLTQRIAVLQRYTASTSGNRGGLQAI